MTAKQDYRYIKRLIYICFSFFLSYLGYGIITYRNNNYFEIIFKGKYNFVDYSSVLIISFLLYFVFSSKVDKTFYSNVLELIKEFRKIFSDTLSQLKNVKLLMGSLILFFSIYGYQISNFTLSLDEEFQMSQVKNIIQWCYEGRFSIGILKNFFMAFGMYEPFFSNFISSLIMLLNGLLFCHFLSKISNKDAFTFSKLVFISIYMSFPSVIVEFMSFSTYCIEVSFGMTLLLISVFIFHEYIKSRKKNYLILDIFLVFFSLGIYQAMATVYITLVSIYFFTKIYANNIENLKDFYRILKEIFVSIGIFLFALLWFFIIYKIATTMHYVQGSIDYINDFSGWNFQQGIFISLKNSLYTLGQIVFHTDIVGLSYFRWYIVAFLLDSVLIICFYKPHYKIKKYLLLGILVEILLSGFYMWLALAATALPLRAWLSVLFVAGFMYYLLAEILINNFKKSLFILGCFGLSILSVRQIQTANELFFNDHKRMEKDLRFAENIYENISAIVTDIENKTVVFIGTEDLADNETIIKNPTTDLYFGGDALGYSLWRRAQEPHRMKGLYAYLGYDLEFRACTSDEYAMAQEEMNIFPLENSILEKESVVYVRLE